MSSDTSYTVQVPEDKAGGRLDRFLSEILDELSRTRLKNLIVEGEVSCRGKAVTNPSAKIKEGEEYIVIVPPAIAAEPVPQDIPLDIVFEDDDVLVLNKPVGMVVHPAAGNHDGTLVNALLAHCGDSLSGIGGVARPGIVHRLDKDTSGLMIVAKNDMAHQHLSKQFADHSLERAYQAIIWGVPREKEGLVENNIGRNPANRRKMAVLQRGGKYALTRYKVLQQFGLHACLVECRLETGRTHQIRVHMASIGHPVMGDPLYGGGGRRLRRELPDDIRIRIQNLNTQLLHAYLIGFEHPRTHEAERFNSPLSSNINEIIELLKRI